MNKGSPDADWSDEDHVLSLPAGENDKFERKGTRSLDLTVAGVKDGDVRAELAKQLSAFANTGGGRIIYGLANDGSVEMGGVSQTIRGRQSTKEWLENVITGLTDPEIIGFKVLPVLPKTQESKIEPGKALYVIEVPDSERAPHQSVSDRRYYVRIGSNSVPAPHRLIEDIRNRAKHPNVEVLVDAADFEVIRADTLPRGALIGIPFHISLRNVGVLKSQNTCLHFQIDVPGAFLQAVLGEEIKSRADSKARGCACFCELLFPLYPEMMTDFTIEMGLPVFVNGGTENHFHPFWTVIDPQVRTLANMQTDLTAATCKWALFADNASPKRGESTLGLFRFNGRMLEMIDRHPRKEEIYLVGRQMFGSFPD